MVGRVAQRTIIYLDIIGTSTFELCRLRIVHEPHLPLKIFEGAVLPLGPSQCSFGFAETRLESVSESSLCDALESRAELQSLEPKRDERWLFGTSWHILAHLGISWHILASIGISWHILAYLGISWHILACSVEDVCVFSSVCPFSKKKITGSHVALEMR